MKPEITVIMPGIRPNNWEKVYASLESSTKRSFELIIIGPFALSESLQLKRNVKYIKDFGCPVRAYNIGILFAEGKYIYPHHADDGYFIHDALDKNLEELESMGDNNKNVIISKYSESEHLSNETRFQDDSYYKLVNAYPINPALISSDWWIFNVVVFHRKYFDLFGGYDIRFQSAPMAFADLAIRAQRDGAIVKMTKDALVCCDHMPGTTGDHAPIHYAQILHDDPLFRMIYDISIEDQPIKFNNMNWKNSPSIWSKRFN